MANAMSVVQALLLLPPACASTAMRDTTAPIVPAARAVPTARLTHALPRTRAHLACLGTQALTVRRHAPCPRLAKAAPAHVCALIGLSCYEHSTSLRILDPTFTLQGTVLDNSGNPISGSKVLVPAAQASGFATTYANGNGVFTIAGLIQSGATYSVTIKVKTTHIYMISFTAPLVSDVIAGGVVNHTFQTTFV